jgi:DNA-binding response OmpR family regulator
MAFPNRTFLIVEHNPDGLELISWTLARKYPEAEIQHVVETADALELLHRESVDAVIVHRPIGMDGLEAIRAIRHARAAIPIIMVSSVDYSREAIEAGATSFLHYDSWLMLGGVVEDVLNRPGSQNPWVVYSNSQEQRAG